jgi:hypothetical protein
LVRDFAGLKYALLFYPMQYKHTCHQLGVCQNRYAHCHGCIKPGNVSTDKKPAKTDTVSLLKKKRK